MAQKLPQKVAQIIIKHSDRRHFERNTRIKKIPITAGFLPWLWDFLMVEAGRVELPSENAFPRLSASVVYRSDSAREERQTDPHAL